MSKIRVHELAKELGKQNKEVMEFLKAKGMDVKSHMSNVEEPYVSMVKEKFTLRGKEHIAKLETPKTEEKVVTAKPEAEKAEAPKKKKNIIRVYHAQNASDGGKGRRRPPSGERRGPARPQGERPARPQSKAPEAKTSEQPKAAAPKPAVGESSVSSAAPSQTARPAAPQVQNTNSQPAQGTQSAPSQSAPSRPQASQSAPSQSAPSRPQASQGAPSQSAPSRLQTSQAVQGQSAQSHPQGAQNHSQGAQGQGSQSHPQGSQGQNTQGHSQGAQGAQNRPQGGQSQNIQGRPQGGQGQYNQNRTQGGQYSQNRSQGGQYNQNRSQGGQGQYSQNRSQGGQGQYNQNRSQGGQGQYSQNRSQGGQGQYNNQNRTQGAGGQGRPQGTASQGGGYRDNRTGERRYNDRPGQGQNRYNAGGQGRPARPGENNGRPARPGDNRGPRPQGGQGGRPQGGNGQRPQGGQGRPDGRFGGPRTQGGAQRPGTRKNDGEVTFTPELTKTSKDSKRERDRENKKKKEFDKGTAGSRRPNQGGFRQNSRLPKALQKLVPQQKPEEKKPEVKEITLPEKMTIRELAEAMKMQPSVIVKKLFLQGILVTVNHEIEFEKAQEIALEYDIIAELEEKVDVIEELLKEEEEDEATMVSRPPVVCVMGHVDHGKTSLLDAIRNTNVTRGEAGGITQHIGAYVVKIGDQKITFLDTPGHEAFTAMRMRGANATDIAVLVVAADDGVMPQTVEAISHAKAAGVEIIVAINKIDKPSANVERVKQELSEYELIPEDWGGSTIFVPVSAHTGEGIDTLLEMILLTAEVAELKANPKRAARGLVIEAQLDKGKGPVATILVQKGTLHVGDFIAAGACSGKVRAMMDDKGRRVKEAGPSTPVEILGLGDVPNAGEILMSFESDKEAKSFAGAFVSENKNRLLEETKGKLSLDNLFDQIQASDLKELPIVVKADVQGSVEAVRQSLVKLSNEEVIVKVIHGGVGAINESDVSLAATSNAIIIGFNVRPDAMAKQLAEQEGVDLRLYKVIYQAIEDVEAAMKGMLDPVFEEKVIGHAEVRQLFKASGVGTIAGSYILDGIFQRNCKVRITRGEEQVFEGELASLKRFKDDVKEVKAGYECGLVFDGFNEIQEEDHVEAYIMVEVPR